MHGAHHFRTSANIQLLNARFGDEIALNEIDLDTVKLIHHGGDDFAGKVLEATAVEEYTAEKTRKLMKKEADQATKDAAALFQKYKPHYPKK